jgi:hypothetical protein
MKSSGTLGLSILTGGLAFVGSANAVDLILNGSFEMEGRVNGGSVLTGWTGFMGTYSHSTEAYYAGPPIPASENPGDLYSWQHRAVSGANGPAGVPQVTQFVDLTTAVASADIDAGRGQYVFSSWLASYTQNPEQPYLTLEFFDAVTNQVGSTVILDRANANFWIGNADPTDLTPPGADNHMFSKYARTNVVPSGARSARVGIGRSPNAGLSGSPDTYVDLVKLDVTTSVVSVPPSVSSVRPSNDAAGVHPDVAVEVVLNDGTTVVNTNTIQFSFDGVPVTPSIARTGGQTTIQYDPPGILPALSSHTFRMVFSDNGAPATTQTNVSSFTVASYYNILLNSPLYLESFDTTPEGSLPAGWSSFGFSGNADTVCDSSSVDIGGLQDLHSACYTNWVVVDSGRFTSNMLTYASHTPESDYQRVLNTNHLNVVNSNVLGNLAQGNIVFANSGYQDESGSQILYLFSPDFNLTGRTNIYLAFNSLWEQNQDSIAAVEYSIDQGATWLPVVYLLNGADILRDAQGNVDAVATFGTQRIGGFEGQATYMEGGETRGGFYGAFIGVDSNRWSQLGPFLSARLDDDPADSKRVEIFSLPAAANQPTVRLRFAHAGTDSWYFGLDNIGLYSLDAVSPPLVNAPVPASLVEGAGNTAAFNVTLSGLGPFSYQWQHAGSNVPGQTNATLVLTNVQPNSAGSYSLVIGYLGGSVTSSPSILSVFTPEPARVVGQWDFTDFSLAATCGFDLEFFNSAVDFSTSIDTTAGVGVPNIDDNPEVTVMAFPGALGPDGSGGYKMRHGLPGTGGGTNVNQYTLIMDVLYPSAANNQRRTLLQTDPFNTNDGEFRIGENNGIGFTNNYHGNILPDTWHRVAFAVDLVGPGPNPIVAKFIDGVKVGQHVLPEGRDGRWSLPANPSAPWALLFADNDIDLQAGYVSSIQLRVGRLSDTAIAAMGKPQATKIPGAVCAQRTGGDITIRWSGSILEAADELSGPWSPVENASNPFHPPTPPGQRKFYRSR